MKESFGRWIGTLRAKASIYEHSARKNGKIVTSPDLDQICNEMEAFLDGFLSKEALK